MKKFIPLLVLSIVFLASCKQENPTQEPEVNSELESESNLDINENEDVKTVPEENKETSEVDKTEIDTYTNTTYGFSLTFPETWADYTEKERTEEAKTIGTFQDVDFGLPGQEDIFSIGIYTKDQIEKLKTEESAPILKARYLGENDKYIFSSQYSPEAVSDELTERRNEVNSILASFAIK